MKNLKEWISFGLFAVVLTGFILVSTFVLTPKREDFGSMWQRFLKEEENSIEVMFFGSSLVYCDVIPALFYEETGASAYVMAGPLQNMPTTYYYVKQMYESQSPSLIAVEITGMFFPEVTEFNLINIGYMPYNLNRLQAVFNGAEKEERLGLLFPLYVYHDRWEELGRKDLMPYSEDSLAGYTYLDSILEGADLEEREVVFSQENYNKNLDYLKKIANLGKEEDSQVLFYITPGYRRVNEGYLNMLYGDIEDIDVDFIDFNQVFDFIGIDETTDFYDTAHFNYRGAEKFTAYFASFINENYALDKKADADLWEERAACYRALIQD